jgi:hypothetical protein
MATADNISTLRRKRGHQLDRLTRTSKRLDEYEQAGRHEMPTLLLHERCLNDAWTQIQAIQQDLEDLDEEECELFADIDDQYFVVARRLQLLMEKAQLASSSKPTSGESVPVAGPVAIKFPDIHLPQFDGTVENWESFHDT